MVGAIADPGKILKTARVFIPDGVEKNFTESHTISNYGWIFNIPNVSGDLGKGYVKARN
ncbi:MAG: hypothetical protein Q7W45_11370 [Bacteroidota bacterium]|nr:hypothetical protein [Bacteroidota bacterium]MDP3147075.1 hypothetical protein [Bacteroidota bacterium]